MTEQERAPLDDYLADIQELGISGSREHDKKVFPAIKVMLEHAYALGLKQGRDLTKDNL